MDEAVIPSHIPDQVPFQPPSCAKPPGVIAAIAIDVARVSRAVRRAPISIFLSRFSKQLNSTQDQHD
jgi:hypothetical protein